MWPARGTDRWWCPNKPVDPNDVKHLLGISSAKKLEIARMSVVCVEDNHISFLISVCCWIKKLEIAKMSVVCVEDNHISFLISVC